MSDWHKVTLSVKDVASGRGIQLQEQFINLHMIAGGPVGAAMFSSTEVMSNDYYFSPVAVDIARPLIIAYGGIPCAPPAKSKLHSLVERDGAAGVPFASE